MALLVEDLLRLFARRGPWAPSPKFSPENGHSFLLWTLTVQKGPPTLSPSPCEPDSLTSLFKDVAAALFKALLDFGN